jgi:hypothetical protein
MRNKTPEQLQRETDAMYVLSLEREIKGWRELHAKQVLMLTSAGQTAFSSVNDAVAAIIVERDALVQALIDAKEDVESWSSYADDYFKKKHNLQRDLDRIQAAIDAARSQK